MKDYKDYLVTFRDKKTSAIISEVKVEAEQSSVKSQPRILVFLAIEKNKENQNTFHPAKCSWSYREF